MKEDLVMQITIFTKKEHCFLSNFKWQKYVLMFWHSKDSARYLSTPSHIFYVRWTHISFGNRIRVNLTLLCNIVQNKSINVTKLIGNFRNSRNKQILFQSTFLRLLVGACFKYVAKWKIICFISNWKSSCVSCVWNIEQTKKFCHIFVIITHFIFLGNSLNFS